MHRALSARHDRFPLSRPFRISRGVRTAADVVTVTVCENGVEGRGEGVPYPRYGESVESVLALIEAVREAIEEGAGRCEVLALVVPGAARNALDCALWDLEAKRSGKSVAARLGAPSPGRIATALTIVIDKPESMARAAEAIARAPLIKVKVDANDPVAAVRAVREAAPEAALIVDPNESWDEALLRAAMPVLEECRVAVLEQPVPAGEDAWLEGYRSPVPICADEAIHTVAELDTVAARYDAVNVKLDKAGGLTAGLELAHATRARGLKLMSGCMVCSSLGIVPALHVARLADWADLDGPLWLAEDRPAAPAGGRLLGLRRLAAALSLLLAGCVSSPAPIIADVLIRGGTVYTGDVEPFEGDVAVRGERIVAVGKRLRVNLGRTIDAKGLIVAPGFIDPHAHVESWLTADGARKRLAAPFLLQGVTTTLVGNDGFGPAHVSPLLASAAAKPVGINYAAFTGFGSIRAQVVGAARRAPSPAELMEERRLVRTAMCAGAIGLSTGLFYAPQSFAETAEIIALAQDAGRLGGIYDTHLRDEGSYGVGLAGSVDEAIAIAREARIPVHISHIKALGVDVHGQAPAIVAKIERARAEGLDLTANQYPWQASGTSLVAALVPVWAQDGGRAAMLLRFDGPALRQRLEADMAENLRRRGGAASLVLVEGRWKGQRLDAIAQTLGLDPVRAAIAAIRESDAATISFNMAPADIETFMRQRWVVTGSDASTGHPRSHGSFAEKYAVYVRDGKVLTLREFIDRSSAMTARIFRLEDRGQLRPGAFADVAVFDPVAYAARATYERPEQTATGMRYVLVNGSLAVDEGEITGSAAGRALAKRPTSGCQ